MSSNITTLGYMVYADTANFEKGTLATRKELGEIRKLIESTTPFYEKHQRSVQVLGEMWDKGRISTAEYNRAIEELNKRLPDNIAKQEQAAESLRKKAEAEHRAAEAAARHRTEMIAQSRDMNRLVNQWKDFGKSDTDRFKERMQSLLSVRQNMSRSEFRDAFTKLRAKDPRIVNAEVVKGINPFGSAAAGQSVDRSNDLQMAIGNLSPTLSRFMNVAGPASGILLGIGVAAGTAAAAWRILGTVLDVSTRNISEQFTEIDRIGDTAEKLGIGAGALSKFESMARLADVEVETLTGALTKMEIKLGDAAMGGEASAKAFESIGLNVDELLALGPEKAFGRIVDAIGKLPTHAIKLNAINDIFGKGSTDIMRMVGSMAELEAQANRTGNTITDKQSAAIDKADKQFKNLGETFAGLWKQATVELAPAFGNLAESLAKVLQDPAVMDQFAGTFKAVATYVQAIADTLPDIVDNAVVLTKTTGGLLEGMAGFAGAGGLSDAASVVKADIAEAVRARKLDRDIESRRKKPASGMNVDDIGARFGLPDGAGGNSPIDAFRKQMADDLYRQQKAQFDFVRGMEQAAAASIELNSKIGELWSQSAGMSSRQLDLQEKLIAKTLEVSRKADEMGLAFGQERERAIQAAQQQVLAEAQMAMAREGQQIRDSLRTPIDMIRETLVRYQELVAFGAITQEEMNRAAGKQLFATLGGGRVMSNPIATAGSQEFIAAQERNAQRSRVERLLSDISATLKAINKQPQLQVEQVQIP